ncbi:hypothetical protein MTR67_052933 [Solanum verrucosum]|uniref:Tf2-1-like SH3-like domain-containing protein n=1 Tax=Solanum verrucosum TaxID=315347 RepID=A0AAF0VA08_SOLVR|nr:hypothetical protein MTR67_052933 [Solanum verrucosum]
MKGVMRFGKKGKLSPRYMGPYQILKCIEKGAYELDLPSELVNMFSYGFDEMLCWLYIVVVKLALSWRRSQGLRDKCRAKGASQGCSKLERTASNSMAITTARGHDHGPWEALWSCLGQRRKAPSREGVHGDDLAKRSCAPKREATAPTLRGGPLVMVHTSARGGGRGP